MELQNIINDSLKELSFEDIVEINGGESAWYWIMYGIGVAGNISNSLRSNPNFGNANIYK